MSGTGLEDERRHVNLKEEYVSNVSSSDFPGHYYAENHEWNLLQFKQKCRMEVQRLSQRSIEFDLEGIDASIANAIRRVLISEVPTVAIENVYVWNNDSVIQDEVLAHRLGLVPLNVDPRLLNTREHGEPPTDLDTVVFKLEIKCERNQNPPKGSQNPEELYINSNVFSSHITWIPQGDQENMFRATPPGPTNPDILLAKLRPGQEINMELHAIRGVGSEHAKWSPVATASYRLLPHIKILEPIPSHLCHKFASCFVSGVVEVVKNPKRNTNEVKIVNPRNDTVSREVLRHKEFEGMVELTRIRDFFLFNVESEGPYRPEELLPEAIKVLRDKFRNVRWAVANLQQEVMDDAMES